ncbi:MAG: hypothetical protein LBQ06_02060, partial [Frankiaceae bacterium]|nr:hypothetical protein [Frankiaceae bacterium]
MPQEESGGAMRSALRVGAGIVAAISAVVAVILVVFGNATTTTRLGMLLGLWTVVIGSFAVIRVHEADTEKAIADGARSEEVLQQAVVQLQAARDETAKMTAQAGRDAAELQAMPERVAIEVRRSVDLERQSAAAQQREFLRHLELMLSRQVESTLERELSSVRDEVSALRAEVVDQL